MDLGGKPQGALMERFLILWRWCIYEWISLFLPDKHKIELGPDDILIYTHIFALVTSCEITQKYVWKVFLENRSFFCAICSDVLCLHQILTECHILILRRWQKDSNSFRGGWWFERIKKIYTKIWNNPITMWGAN